MQKKLLKSTAYAKYCGVDKGDTGDLEEHTQLGDTLAHFLHKKKDSSLWFYRRRYPQDVAQILGKPLFVKSLQTTVKRDAERLSRRVSVEFDAICHDALLRRDALQAVAKATPNQERPDWQADSDAVLAGVPRLIRAAAQRVVEEQQKNPKGWQGVVKNWRSFYEAMKVGAVPPETQRPAIEAQAILHGIHLAVQGKPLPVELAQPVSTFSDGAEASGVAQESWTALCRRALKKYRERVGQSRYQLAESRLLQVTVESTAVHHVEVGLLEWSKARLNEVQPRTVKTQLDCMVSALRGVLPKLQCPYLKELEGVMLPRTGDRQSMPLQAIQEALGVFRNRPASTKVRIDYGGGASQFDAIAVEVLAVLGMRPRELMEAKSSALHLKTDVFGQEGLYFRVVAGKNKASEREIPLSDGAREVVDVARLREMLEWQERNPRAPHGAVSSMGTRFSKVAKSYTLYQMRHSWKDVAVHSGVDFELRERILGHKVPGTAAVYGSGIPLREGLEALMAVRSEIFG